MILEKVLKDDQGIHGKQAGGASLSNVAAILQLSIGMWTLNIESRTDQGRDFGEETTRPFKIALFLPKQE
jgi:hypothetical protein